MSERPAFIYVLTDSRVADPVGRVRYVGRTVNVERRLKAHQQTCRAGEHTARADWMRAVFAAGGDVLLEIVETTSVDCCVVAEMAWVQHFRSLGSRLMNLTDGGDGLLNPSAETRQRIGAAKLGHKFWVGKHHTAQAKAKIAAAHRGIAMHPHTRAALNAPETRARQAATARARVWTADELEAQRAHARRVWHNPSARAKMRATVSTPAHRAMISARQSTAAAVERIRQVGRANKGRQHTPEFCAHRADLSRLYRHTAATKQKMSAWQRGGDSHRAKLTWGQVREIRARHGAGDVSQRQLARDYHVQPRTINLIVHNQTWAEGISICHL